jgi:hypothetical protein
MQNSRAKFVQNFFEFYRILSDSQKMKNDYKRSHIKGLEKFNPNQSDTSNAHAEIPTLMMISKKKYQCFFIPSSPFLLAKIKATLTHLARRSC